LYDPASRAGVELLGHELAHVVQQRDGRVVNPFGTGVAIVQDPALEAEADRLGQEIASEIWLRPSVAPTGALRGAVKNRRYDPRGPVSNLADPPVQPSLRYRSFMSQRSPASPISGGHPAAKAMWAVQRMEEKQEHVGVEAYKGTWDEGQPIVHDALKLKAAWKALSKTQRPEKRDTPEAGQCSGKNWKFFDEGVDVAKEIANVDGNEDRDDGVSLWRAFNSLTEEKETVGILILDTVNIEYKDGLLEVFRVRWLVGYPGVKGVGRALLAKADECNLLNLPMYVISAGSAAGFYEKMGYTTVITDKPCGEQVCGCLGLLKPKKS
jgi:hypothetical protein